MHIVADVGLCADQPVFNHESENKINNNNNLP